MGKAQYKKRIRSARHRANELPVGHDDIPNPSPDSSKSKSKKSANQRKEREATIAVIEKISSPASHDRVWSLAAISHLVLSSVSTRQLLLSKNLVRLLIDRLTEDEGHDDVLVEVTGVLRNLVIEGGRDVCGEMANKGILKPLKNLVSKLLTSIVNFQDSISSGVGIQNSTAQALHWSRLFLNSENVVIILWSLAETSTKWLDLVSALQDITSLLLRILQQFADQTSTPTSSRYAVPSSCALACGQCFYALTEDNPTLVKRVLMLNDALSKPLIDLSNINEQHLKELTPEDSENLQLLKVVSMGILRNIIFHSRKAPKALSFKSAYDEKMPQSLVGKLEVNLNQLAAEATEASGAILTVSLSNIDVAKASVQGPSSAELKLESIERRLTILQFTLELLGEWCAVADDFDSDEDNISSSSSLNEPTDTDGMDHGNNSEEDDDDQSSSSENEDVQMSDIPASNPVNQANGIGRDHDDPIKQDSDAMDIEKPQLVDKESQSALFSNLLNRLHHLSQPILRPSENHQFQATLNGTMPTAASANGLTLAAAAGNIPDLINELLNGIRRRAIDALNNMMITLDRLKDSSPDFLLQFVSNNQETLHLIWKSGFLSANELSINNQSFQQGSQAPSHVALSSHQRSGGDLLASLLTCLWSFSRVHLRPEVLDRVPLKSAPDQTDCLLKILRTTENEICKVRALSILVCLGNRPDVSIEENAIVGGALMDIISKSSVTSSDIPRVLLIEALDGVFDVYADETRDYDEPVFVKGNFLDIIQVAVPAIDSIVKQIDKRKDPALRQRADEVKRNLKGFIEYRKNLKH